MEYYLAPRKIFYENNNMNFISPRINILKTYLMKLINFLQNNSETNILRNKWIKFIPKQKSIKFEINIQNEFIKV